MENKKYYYNPKTLTYEPVQVSLRSRMLRVFAYIVSVFVLAVVLLNVAGKYFETPREKSLERELEQMAYYYKALSGEFDKMNSSIEHLQEKDAAVHRVILGMDPIDQSIWEAGVGGYDKFTNITNYKNSGELIKRTLAKADKLKRKIELQNRSLDTLQQIALAKENRLASIPSIKPVRLDKLKRGMNHLSGFGIRIHPVHKVKKFHKGIDFTAPRGTPIQATGDGTVVVAKNQRSGFGKHVKIDHGYGYVTVYAHMSEIKVKPGEKVKKGQEIGQVGNTGLSTAPHCHYEVHYNGKAVDPIDFCLDGLTPEEYKELVEHASMENQSFD
jgi:septal ring factor EnvC (AmiA/AmiB activator)